MKINIKSMWLPNMGSEMKGFPESVNFVDTLKLTAFKPLRLCSSKIYNANISNILFLKGFIDVAGIVRTWREDSGLMLLICIPFTTVTFYRRALRLSV